MVHSFFQFPRKVEVLILLFTFFQFYSVVSRDSKVDNFSNSIFFLIIIRSGLLAGIRWSVCMSESHRSLCGSFSKTAVHIPFVHTVKFKMQTDYFIPARRPHLVMIKITRTCRIVNFAVPAEHLPTQSCLVLYSFRANLLHSLIMWLMVSSLSPHSLHLRFCCVLSIFALIWLVLTALFCAAIRRDSVSLLNFPFLSQVQVFSCEMLFISRSKRT